jgi:hypothetical protein
MPATEYSRPERLHRDVAVDLINQAVAARLADALTERRWRRESARAGVCLCARLKGIAGRVTSRRCVLLSARAAAAI